MRRRAIVLVSMLVIVAVLVILVVRWFDDGPRARLEAILSDALNREVTIGALQIDAAARAVELRDVTVANPPGLAGPPFLRLRRVRLEVSLQELLERRIVGTVDARDLDLRIVRSAEGTNLEGLLPTRAQREDDPPEVHLDFRVQGSRIALEDLERGHTLTLDGVSLEGLVSNRNRIPIAQARLDIEEVDLGDIRLRELELVAHASEEGVRIPSLHGTVGAAGRLTGSGRLHLRDANAWAFELVAQGVALDRDVTPIVQRFFPVLATATATADDPVRGLVDVEVQLAGRGLQWDAIAASLEGTGKLTVQDLAVPGDALLVSLAALAGRPPAPYSVENASATFTFAERWIELSRVDTGDEELRLPVSGRISFAGELDMTVDLMPLVEVYGGGVYENVARYATSIPVRIGGTIDAPAVRPPTARDVAGSVGGALLRRSLGSPGAQD
jgi:hypothetical protein